MARKPVKRIETVFGQKVEMNEQYYLGNKSLPTAESQYEWTPEMVAALAKSKDDVHYFAETFFTIINGDRKRENIQLREYQKRMLKTMADENRVIFNTSRQIGKCVSLNTKVLCRLKWLPIPIKIKISTFYKIQKGINYIKNKIKNLFSKFVG